MGCKQKKMEQELIQSQLKKKMNKFGQNLIKNKRTIKSGNKYYKEMKQFEINSIRLEKS